MCGFISIHSSGKSLARHQSSVPRMLASIAHRGPDGEGMHHVPNQAFFGHRRLAIIDLEHGAQPMVSECGRYTLVYNGQVTTVNCVTN